MKIKKISIAFLALAFCLVLNSCFSLKNSPFNASEWVMQNLDDKGQLYYHHLILNSDHTAMLRVSYADSTNIIVWNGTYKINSKKINFNFTECVRYENGAPVGTYKAGQMIKFYTGEYYYSLGLIEEDSETKRYHLQLIRPKNYFYGETKDIFGNLFEEFVKFN